MKSRINKSVKDLYNKRYAAQFGKVPEDPNSDEFSEYLQKLKDADLTTQALKLQEAIELDAGAPNPLEKAMKDAENRDKSKTFFRRFLYDQDEDENWNLSKTKVGVLTVLLLAGVTGAVVLGSPKSTAKNITANTSTAKPEESTITGSAVAGAPLEVGTDNMDSLVQGPTGMDIQKVADNVCGSPAADGTPDPDCPPEAPLTSQVQNTTELAAEANRPEELPLNEPTVQAPVTDPYVSNYTPQSSGVVPLPVESQSTLDSPGSSQGGMYPTEPYVPSNPELSASHEQQTGSQGALTGPGGSPEPLVQGSSGIYQRPPKVQAAMTVSGLKSTQGSQSGGSDLKDPSGASSTSSSQTQNNTSGSSNTYKRALVQSSLKVLNGSGTAQGGASGNASSGTSTAGGADLNVIKPVPSTDNTSLNVVKPGSTKSDNSLSVIKPVPPSTSTSLNVVKPSKTESSLNVIKPAATKNEGSLNVIKQPKTPAGNKVVYQKATPQGNEGNAQVPAGTPQNTSSMGVLSAQQKPTSSSMTAFTRKTVTGGSTGGSQSNAQESTGNVQGYSKSVQSPSGSGTGMYSSSKSPTQGGAQKIYERPSLPQEVTAAVNPETSVVATNAVANVENPEVVARNQIKKLFGYVPGNFVEGTLVTELITAEAAAAPVVLRTNDGVVWIGTASVSPDRRVQVSLSRLVAQGVEYPVTGMVFSVAGAPGLDGIFEDQAPTLSSDVVRAGINGVSEYVQNLKDAKNVTAGAAGQLLQSSQAPSLGITIAGNIAELAKLPDRPVFVNVVRVPKGTPILVAYGIEAITGDRFNK